MYRYLDAPPDSSYTANPGLGFPSVPGSWLGADGKAATAGDALHPSFSKLPGAPASASSSPACGDSWAPTLAFLTAQAVLPVQLHQSIHRPCAQLGPCWDPLLPCKVPGSKRKASRQALLRKITASKAETAGTKAISVFTRPQRGKDTGSEVICDILAMHWTLWILRSWHILS